MHVPRRHGPRSPGRTEPALREPTQGQPQRVRTRTAGWEIASDGVTEWRGWCFATDEFWTNSERGQGRETNVRAGNVFAVADSDEWDDKAHDAGQFDSTLV